MHMYRDKKNDLQDGSKMFYLVCMHVVIDLSMPTTFPNKHHNQRPHYGRERDMQGYIMAKNLKMIMIWQCYQEGEKKIRMSLPQNSRDSVKMIQKVNSVNAKDYVQAVLSYSPQYSGSHPFHHDYTILKVYLMAEIFKLK